MTTCSNTPTSPSGSKEQLRPWITISKHQVESKLHLMPRTLFIEEIHTGDKIEIKEEWIITTDKFASVETLWKIMHKRWDIENNVFHQLKTEWHLDHCFLHSSTGVETVLMFMILAFNLMQLYFFRCIRNFRKKKMLQIDIIEDIKDERFTIEDDWDNPLFIKT